MLGIAYIVDGQPRLKWPANERTIASLPEGVEYTLVTEEEADIWGEKHRPEAEIAAEVRTRRDALLAETDYLAMPDYPLTEAQAEAVRAYRQALRDITEQEGFPRDVVWPDKPELRRNDD